MPKSAIDCRNVIIDRLENLHQYEHLFNDPQPQGSTSQVTQFISQQHHSAQDTQPILHTEQHPESISTGGSIGSLFDIPITPQGNDPEEEMFRRRMQRKKKKGRRM